MEKDEAPFLDLPNGLYDTKTAPMKFGDKWPNTYDAHNDAARKAPSIDEMMDTMIK
jgi:hypothetical protein